MKLSHAAIGIFFVAIAIFAAYLVWMLSLSAPFAENSLKNPAEFGDSFGIITSFFSGLAFAGLMVTIHLQREELSESRQVFKSQKFEDAFYSLLEFYKHNLNEIHVSDDTSEEPHKGVGALSFLLKKYNQSCQGYVKYLSCHTTEEQYKFFIYIEARKILVPQARYFGTLESILSLIENEIECESKRAFYIKIVASQLTVHEVKYLFYQCLVSSSETRLVRLINELKLIDERIYDANLNKTTIKFYNETHGARLPYDKKEVEIPFTNQEMIEFRKSHNA